MQVAAPAYAGYAEEHCPLCNRVLSNPYRYKTLYEIPVCRRCRNGFANRRQGAFVVDAIVWQVFLMLPFQLILLGWLLNTVRATSVGLVGPVSILMGWLALPALFCCKDGFGGKSPGKALFGVRAVDARTLEPISFGQSFKRNLPTLIPYVGVLVIAVTMLKGRRWGDGWAGTRVVWDKYAFRPPFDTRGLLCTECGYNLTGNVSGICPECGTPVPQRTDDAPV